MADSPSAAANSQLLTPELMGSLIELAATDNLQQTLELILSASIDSVEGDRGALFMVVADELELAVVRGDFDQSLRPFAQSLPREALRSLQVKVLDQSTRSRLDGDVLDSVFSKSLGSVICMPLVIAEEPHRPDRNDRVASGPIPGWRARHAYRGPRSAARRERCRAAHPRP